MQYIHHPGESPVKRSTAIPPDLVPLGKEVATLAGGCFWCLEAVFDRMLGVEAAESGYLGGHVQAPTYEQVCRGDTAHAEAVRVTFDPAVTTFRELLEVFFAIHDPTTLNRQGNDVGTQYRSAIFHHSPEQKRIAEELVAELERSGAYRSRIVTEIVPATDFWVAEDYHQEYFANNPNQPYCMFVVHPKVQKFRKQFAAKVAA
jgi:peptide-methionine (S)-S-oxide reductase